MPEFSTQQLIDDIAECLSQEQYDRVARQSLTAFDALNAEIIAQKRLALDCCEGCSICCTLRVDVFAHEIFPIVHHVRSHFTDAEIAGLMVRLSAHSEKVTAITPFEHATQNIQCPMLQEGRCAIYAARPHSCRRHHSRDVNVCQFTFDHPTDLETPAAHDRELFRTLTEVMVRNIEAYAELGFDHTIYELGTALLEALTDSESWERWRNREQAFLEASVTPAG